MIHDFSFCGWGFYFERRAWSAVIDMAGVIRQRSDRIFTALCTPAADPSKALFIFQFRDYSRKRSEWRA
jgi:hypothetical protein